jgi:heme A synthase
VLYTTLNRNTFCTSHHIIHHHTLHSRDRRGDCAAIGGVCSCRKIQAEPPTAEAVGFTCGVCVRVCVCECHCVHIHILLLYIYKRMPHRMIGVSGLIGLQGLVGWWMVKSGLEHERFEKNHARVHVSPYRLCFHLLSAFGRCTSSLSYTCL